MEKAIKKLLGEIKMIFKVYYQVSTTEVPIRENTRIMYVKGDSVADIRLKIKNEPFNIEFVQVLNDAHLAYEQENNEDFKVLELG